MPDNADKGGKLVALINPSDNRIYSVKADQADRYTDAGWAAPDAQPEVRRQEIDSALSSWKDYVPAVAMQVVRGVPFATTLLNKTVDKDTFKYLSQQSKAFEDEHGVLSAALSGAGGIASVAALSSGLGALGGALGIGAEAAAGAGEAAAGLGETLGGAARAGAGVADAAGVAAADAPLTSALTGLGRSGAADAAAAGEAAAGEGLGAGAAVNAGAEAGAAGTEAGAEATAGLGSQATADAGAGAAEASSGASGLGAEAGLGADAASVGAQTGAEAGAGPGTDFGFGLGAKLSSLAPQGSLARTAATAAAESAAYGAVYRIDNAAIEHALQPEGQEKLLFSANDILMDAALGAGIPVGLKGLGRVLGSSGKAIEGGALKMFRNAVMRGNALDAIEKQGRWGDLKETLHPLIGLSNERIGATLKTNVDLAAQGLQTMKDKYTGLTATALEKGAVLDALRPILGPDKTKTYKMTLATFKQKKVDLDSIQKLADKIKRQVVWTGEFDPGSTNQRIRDAYIEVVNLGSDMLKRAQLPGINDHLQWQMFNKQYSNNLLVYAGMRSKEGMDVSDLISRMGSAAMTGGALASMGLAGGTAAEAALRTGSWSVLHHVKAQHIAPFAAKLGKGMQAADQRIANALEAGLYGAAGQASKFNNPLRFDDAAATVALAAADPAKTIQNLQTVMDKQGIPQEISVPVVQKQVAGLTHLHNSRPVRNDAPDVVTDDQGDPVQNQRWLDQVHTFQDPAHGITYPTADNMRILKQFYPEVLYSAQQAALQQIAKDPNLPIESKMWASQVLERPISNITSPTFAQTLNEARKAAAEASQPKPSGGSSSQNAVQSSLSRADALQNRE